MNYKPILYITLFLLLCAVGYLYLMGVQVNSRITGRYTYGFSSSSIYYTESDYYTPIERLLCYWEQKEPFGANVFSFEAMGTKVARDNQHAYWGNEVIEGADAKTFRAIDIGYEWSRDDYNTYFRTKALPPDLDYEQISDYSRAMEYDDKYILRRDSCNFANVVECIGYVKRVTDELLTDDQYVYYGTFYSDSILRLPLPHPEDFTYYKTRCFYFDYTLFRIGKTLYINDKEIKGADINSFQYVGSIYSKDKNHVYAFEKIVTNADPKTFENMAELYYRDGKRVYYYDGTIIEGADAPTFVLLDRTVAKDKDHIFCNNKLDPRPDVTTFEVDVKDVLYRDKTGIWYEDSETKKLERENF